MGMSISASTNLARVFDGGEWSDEFTITAGDKWSVVSHPDWATLSPESGSAGETTVKAKFEYRGFVNGNSNRQGDIVVQIDGTNIQHTVKVIQYY